MFKQIFVTTTTASNRSINAVVAYDGGLDETLNAHVSHAGGVQPSLRRNKEPLAGLISWRSDTPWFAGATSQLSCGPFSRMQIRSGMPSRHGRAQPCPPLRRRKRIPWERTRKRDWMYLPGESEPDRRALISTTITKSRSIRHQKTNPMGEAM